MPFPQAVIDFPLRCFAQKPIYAAYRLMIICLASVGKSLCVWIAAVQWWNAGSGRRLDEGFSTLETLGKKTHTKKEQPTGTKCAERNRAENGRFEPLQALFENRNRNHKSVAVSRSVSRVHPLPGRPPHCRSWILKHNDFIVLERDCTTCWLGEIGTIGRAVRPPSEGDEMLPFCVRHGYARVIAVGKSRPIGISMSMRFSTSDHRHHCLLPGCCNI